MRVYRPSSTPVTAPSVAVPITAAWDHEIEEWSRILAQAIERYQQSRPTVKEEQDQEEKIYLSCQQQKANEISQAEQNAKVAQQTSSLACYKRVWSVALFGLVMSGFLFLILFTNVLRDTEGSQLGVKTKCDVVPSVKDISIFSVIYWIAVAVDIVSKSAAVMVVANVAMLSKVLYKDNAAYWKRLNEYSRIGSCVGAAMTTIPLHWGILLMIRGKCGGGICLNLGLATLAVMNWTLLSSIVSALILESGHKAIAGQWKVVSDILMSKRRSREVREKNGWEL